MKYCPEIVAKICEHVSNGLTAKDSCTLEDISEQTFYTWLSDPEKPDFRESVKKAEQGFKESNLKIIRFHAAKNWVAAAWLCERKFPEEFALRTKQEFSGWIEGAEKDAEKKDRVVKLRGWLNKVADNSATKQEPTEKDVALVPA